ncbi:class I SAM-dependent methyltransferase [Salinactinospora qingdaonensis]|uniref:Methyltransferase n=1 Tax=Salinactinospora qingdaonensis TaxID=702744 RepID=A0ABP7GI72_9ACTN
MAQHYFDSDPGAASRPTTVNLVLDDLHLRLATDRGIFSPDRVDPGTRILLETVPPPPTHGHLLDLGCGYGPIALTMATRSPAAAVVGVDVNRRALDLAVFNAQYNHLYNVDFFQVTDDGAPHPHTSPAHPTALSGPFAAIWSNPPIRIGKDRLHTLLRTWLTRLSPEGTAHLVVHRHLGADSLQRWLDTHHLPSQRIASRSGYRVLRITSAPAAG